MFNRHQEAEIRRIARQEAKRVLNEYLEQRRKQRIAKEEAEERIHQEALAEALGPLGQG